MAPNPPRRPSAIAVIVKVPCDSARPHDLGTVLVATIRAALATPEGLSADPDDAQAQRLDVVAIGPQQLTVLDGDFVTVTYPVGATTVMSVQPDGTVSTRPAGTRGPYETGLRRPDRIIFAPLGPNGPVYLVPFAEAIPNE